MGARERPSRRPQRRPAPPRELPGRGPRPRRPRVGARRAAQLPYVARELRSCARVAPPAQLRKSREA
ncbi:hypothetical protein E3O21_18930 [Cryobacterium flavum]|uniref:Uncharacterized protein n=1 Tax=Cryobacterium flavum TaxID=1424659 RepID=A0ABY2HXF2_9MICO|nr:hypothetical protein E3O21_18930 [Cryobacterium flavum]